MGEAAADILVVDDTPANVRLLKTTSRAPTLNSELRRLFVERRSSMVVPYFRAME